MPERSAGLSHSPLNPLCSSPAQKNQIHSYNKVSLSNSTIKLKNIS